MGKADIPGWIALLLLLTWAIALILFFQGCPAFNSKPQPEKEWVTTP